jgi:hypothetical protein
MIRMIATTISNSISEKPFCFRISFSPLLRFKSGLIDPLASFALHRPKSRESLTHDVGTSRDLVFND